MDIQADQCNNLGFYAVGSQDLMDSGVGLGNSIVDGSSCLRFNSVHDLQQQQMEQMMIMFQQNQQHQQQQRNKYWISTDDDFERQSQEINRFLYLQNERLKAVLHEQGKQQMAFILRKVESEAQTFLRQKDKEVLRATKKAMDLQECIHKMEMEKQSWEKAAKEREASIISLNNTLAQVKEDRCCSSSYGYGSLSQGCCCNGLMNKEEKKKMACKGCRSQNSSVLFLPCRHLCCCKSCEPLFDLCPVCKSVKNATIEVSMC